MTEDKSLWGQQALVPQMTQSSMVRNAQLLNLLLFASNQMQTQAMRHTLVFA
jgi:hypothetical protein